VVKITIIIPTMNKMEICKKKNSQSLSEALRSRKDNTLQSNDLQGRCETGDTSEVADAYAQAISSA
jgi:hypothetical protein